MKATIIPTSERDELIAALRAALPYVEKIAAGKPTEMGRQQRKHQAVKDAALIWSALANARATQ